MLELEILVLELLAVDALAAGAVAVGKVTALDHELLDDAVELGALVVEGLAALAEALLAGAEGAEVLGRLGHHVVVQLHYDAPSLPVADVDLEEDAAAARGGGVCLFGGHCSLLLLLLLLPLFLRKVVCEVGKCCVLVREGGSWRCRCKMCCVKTECSS